MVDHCALRGGAVRRKKRPVPQPRVARSRGTGPGGWTVVTTEVPLVDLQAHDAERAPQGYRSVTVVQGQGDVAGVTNVGVEQCQRQVVRDAAGVLDNVRLTTWDTV